MRRFAPAFITLIGIGVILSDGAEVFAQRDANSVLAAARAALGGDAKLAAIKTLIANGRTRQVRGDNLVPIEFEIQIELPNKYSRFDEFPAQDAGPTVAGFVGDDLVLIPRPVLPPPRPGMPAPPANQMEMMLRQRLMTSKQDFARLMLGMFATSLPGFPLTFTYAAQAEAPQGKADVIDVKGPMNFAARLFIHADTHLPILLTWQTPAGPAGRGGPGGPPAAPPAPSAPAPPTGVTIAGEKPPTPPQPPSPAQPGVGRGPGGPPPMAMVEQRMFFADHREVDGIKFPFRIRRAAGAETTEETTFDRFRINAKIDPRRFDTTAK